MKTLPSPLVHCLSVLPVLMLGLLPAPTIGQTNGPVYTFTTLTNRASIGSDDGTGSAARFSSPQGVAVDSAGNLFVADTGNHTIRRITPARVVTTIAGSAGQPGSADGAGATARFDRPNDVVVDGGENLYVADTGNHTIRRISPSGVVTTLAGDPGHTGFADGTGSAALFSKPAALALSTTGDLFVADYGNNAVRKIMLSGVVTTLIDSSSGVSGPRCIVVDAAGNVIVGTASRLYRIAPTGGLTPLAGGGYGVDDGVGSAAGFEHLTGLAIDGTGVLWAADASNIRRITPDGVVTTTAYSDQNFGRLGDARSDPQFGPPVGLAIDTSGNLYFADIANTVHRMQAGSLAATMLAGCPGQGNYVFQHLTLDRPGNLYVSVGGPPSAGLQSISPTGVVSPVAGGGPFPYANGTGSAASFYEIDGIAAGPEGNLYVTDSFYHQVRKITTPGGVVTTLATNVGALNWILGGSMSVAADDSGNVYVAVWQHHIIQKITATGVVSTFAGSYDQSGAADGTGGGARFNNPYALTADLADNLYVLDQGNAGSVRKISPAGVVTTVATGLTLTIEPALLPPLSSYAQITVDSPRSIALDRAGSIYLTYYYSHVIRRLSPSGTITTIGGAVGEPGSADGTGGAARFDGPGDIALDYNGTIYVIDEPQGTIRLGWPSSAPIITMPPANQTVTGGQSAVFAVNAGSSLPTSFQWQRLPAGSATWENLNESGSYRGTTSATLVVNPTTAVMSGDSLRCLVTNVAGSVTSPTAVLTVLAGTPLAISTFAGQAGASGSADGSRSSARFLAPSDVAVDGAGNLYVADTGNQTIRKVTSTGVTTLAGLTGASGVVDGTGTAARFFNPSGVAVDGRGSVYVADTDNDTIRRIAPGGVVTTLAGQAGSPGMVDGIGSAAHFNGPSGIVADSTGNLFVADTLNHLIRKIAPDGTVTTLAGKAGNWGHSDGTGSAARFLGPQGLALDAAGNLYVADTNDGTIRKIVLSTAAVTTVAGQSGYSHLGYADGPAAQAQFNFSSGIAADGAGNLYVADTDNNAIRQISPAGVSTIAGLAGVAGSADGVGTAARFNYPSGIAADSAGNLYIADTNNHTIRLAYFAAAPAITAQPQGQTVTVGFNAQFSVAASGRPAPTYQWSFNGAVISGATSSTLGLTKVQSSQVGNYTVTVTNASGSATSAAATLTVNALSTGSSSSGGAGGGVMDAWFVGLLVVAGAVRCAGIRGGSRLREGMCRQAGFSSRRANGRAASCAPTNPHSAPPNTHSTFPRLRPLAFRSRAVGRRTAASNGRVLGGPQSLRVSIPPLPASRVRRRGPRRLAADGVPPWFGSARYKCGDRRRQRPPDVD